MGKGGHSYAIGEVINQIIDGTYTYLIQVIGIDNKTGKEVKYGARTYEEINDASIEELKNWAIEHTKMENVHKDITLSKIKVFSLEKIIAVREIDMK